MPRSVTTVIDALEQAGLVRRAIDPANRRAIRLHLTEKGTAVREEMRQARRQASEDLFAPLPPGERDQLIRLLSVLDDAPDDRTPPQSPASERRLRDTAARADNSVSGG